MREAKSVVSCTIEDMEPAESGGGEDVLDEQQSSQEVSHTQPKVLVAARDQSAPVKAQRHNRKSSMVFVPFEDAEGLTLAALVKAGGGGVGTAVDEASVGAENSVSAQELAAIRRFQDAAISDNTRRGYKTDWLMFTDWCRERSTAALPAHPLTVAAYLASMARFVDSHGAPFYSPGTISRRLSAINRAHESQGLPKPGDHPDVSAAMKGIRRKNARPAARKAPLLLQELRRTLEEIDHNSWPAGVIGHRDAAILTMGMIGAFRRSELAALRVTDVRRHPEDGLLVTLIKSKTDQEGLGFTKALPFGTKHPATCAPCAFARWIRVLAAAAEGRSDLIRVLRDSHPEEHICREQLLELRQIDPYSPLFRPVTKHGSILDRHLTGQTVNDMLRRRVAAIELDSAEYGGHSLRAGFITQAFRDGATHHEVMRQSGHRDYRSVDVYSRERDPLKHNAVGKMDL